MSEWIPLMMSLVLYYIMVRLFGFFLCRIVVARSFERRVPSVTYPELMSVSASTCHLVEFRINCVSFLFLCQLVVMRSVKMHDMYSIRTDEGTKCSLFDFFFFFFFFVTYCGGEGRGKCTMRT